MKERPILYSGAMVRGVISGRKSQTRRKVKGIALEWLDQGFTPAYVADPDNDLCPYGRVGDRLWVRETFALFSGIEPQIQYVYRADKLFDTPAKEHLVGNKWKPSIFMPRAASRITLEITSIRIERLQQITDQDAIAEGIESFHPVPGDGAPTTRYKAYHASGIEPFSVTNARVSFALLWDKINGDPTTRYKAYHASGIEPFSVTNARVSFALLWDKINGNGELAWAENPWVWVIEFKKL